MRAARMADAASMWNDYKCACTSLEESKSTLVSDVRRGGLLGLFGSYVIERDELAGFVLLELLCLLSW